jgi:hypothetical protein
VHDEGGGFPTWVLERYAAAQRIEQGGPQAQRPSGLGAGLDVVRRLSNDVSLSNDGPHGGARVAARLRRREGKA